MIVGEVTIPEALVEAHRDGDLVIFVGAGASMGPPSDIPGFKQLTKLIADEAHFPDADLDAPDVTLGRIDADGQVDVHGRITAHVGHSASSPNPYHAAIASIAIAAPEVRIVTTNYDQHLETVLLAQGWVGDRYRAPALPVGDDFSGLVYLHGCLDQPPQRLVATDADFGVAYLTDAWAARFLERMFARYAVLFVGYSHDDVVMTYLARGLRLGTKQRYILTDEPDRASWKPLHIEPIAYDNQDRAYAGAPRALVRWSDLATWGLLDHRQRLAELLAGEPSQIPEDVDYLDRTCSDAATLRFFVELATEPVWLEWIASRPIFGTLFARHPADDARRRLLANWFASNFVSEGTTELALGLIRDRGGHLGPDLWWAIAAALHRLGSPKPAWAARWALLVIRDANPQDRLDLLEYLLHEWDQPAGHAVVLALFEFLLTPRVELERPFMDGLAPRMEIGFATDHHGLDEAYAARLKPLMQDHRVRDDLMTLAEEQLRASSRIARAAVGSGWDAMSYGRSAIEQHPQDAHRGVQDVLIDTLRDCLELELEVEGDLGIASAMIARFFRSDVPLLRRIAVHGWTQRTDQDAASKLSFVLEADLVFDYVCKHEVFRLIATCLRDAPEPIASRLVERVVKGPPSRDDTERAERLREYEIHNALVWIARHAPGLESAQSALAASRERNPDFGDRPHPDLDHWIESGWTDDTPVMSPDELHDRLAGNAEGVLRELSELADDTDDWRNEAFSRGMRALSATVNAHPADGLKVLQADVQRRDEILRALIQGWTGAAIDKTTASEIAGALLDLNLGTLAHEIANMLLTKPSDEDSPVWSASRAARQLALALWDILPREMDEATFTLSSAINDPAGKLAEYWINVVSADWRRQGTEWIGPDAGTRVALDLLVGDTNDRRCVMAQPVLASQLHFLWAADAEWCRREVLPLLDWSRNPRAAGAWTGFLSWGRWNDQLLRAGLSRLYLQAAASFEDGSEFGNLGRQLAGHLSDVTTRGERDVIDRAWREELTKVAPASRIADWLQAVGERLGRLLPDERERQWDEWIREYWQQRLDTVPRALTPDEASALALIAPRLTHSFRSAVDMAIQRPASVRRARRELGEIDDAVLQRDPESAARLVAHLLAGTEPPFWDATEVKRIFDAVRGRVPAETLRTIQNEALRLDIPGAGTW